MPVTVSESSHTLLEDKSVRIKGTSFSSGNAQLKSSVIPQLDGVVEFANAYPDATLEVYGHTSSTGSENNSTKLSVKHAETVKTYLVKHGVDPGRIIIKGMGSAPITTPNLVVPSTTESRFVQRSSNRLKSWGRTDSPSA